MLSLLAPGASCHSDMVSAEYLHHNYETQSRLLRIYLWCHSFHNFQVLFYIQLEHKDLSLWFLGFRALIKLAAKL